MYIYIYIYVYVLYATRKRRHCRAFCTPRHTASQRAAHCFCAVSTCSMVPCSEASPRNAPPASREKVPVSIPCIICGVPRAKIFRQCANSVHVAQLLAHTREREGARLRPHDFVDDGVAAAYAP